MNEEYYSYISKFFSKWASVYNIITLPLSRTRDKVAIIAGAKEGSRILDVCCGTGRQTFAFGKMGYEVIGIDLSEGMLEIARRENKYSNVRFEIADAVRIPFEDNYFDVSCISFGLHDMPRNIMQEVLGEMKRVSREIVIVDYNIPRNKLSRLLRVSLISFYETKYFKDFAKHGLDELLQQHDLKVVREAYALINFVKISVCKAN